jgi:hypothetical protein
MMTPLPSENRYRLDEEHSFIVERDAAGPVAFTIPKGYTWDGASVPRIFHRIVTPFSPKVIIAALEHDYLCDKKPSHVAYTQAAAHFRDQLHVGRFRKWMMYRAVLYFGPRW